MPQQLVVYGARCTWWDYIENAGSRPMPPMQERDRFGRPTGRVRQSPGMPCCPHCSSPLFQMDVADWKKGIEAQAEKERGYHDLIGFAKGKCFPNFEEVRKAFAAQNERSH